MDVKREPSEIDLASLVGPGIIAIDGDQGSGKSTLAREIQAATRSKVVSLDDFLVVSGGSYLEQLDADGLISEIRSAGAVPLILEGVLMLEVLDRIGTKSDFVIFSRTLREGAWEYASYVGDESPLPKSRLTREIALYYRDYKPWMMADLCMTLSFSIRPN